MWWTIVQPILIVFIILTIEKYKNNKVDIDKIIEDITIDRMIERNKRANKNSKGR